MSTPRVENGIDRRVAALEQGLAVQGADIVAIKAGQADINAKVDTLLSRQSSQGRPNWQALSVVVVVVAGLWGMATLPISEKVAANDRSINALSGLAAKVAVSEVNDAQSSLDRQKTNTLTEAHTIQLTSLKEEIARIKTATLEQEGQHNTHDQVRGLIQAHQHQIDSILWQERFGYPLPPVLYHPKVAQDRVVK